MNPVGTAFKHVRKRRYIDKVPIDDASDTILGPEGHKPEFVCEELAVYHERVPAKALLRLRDARDARDELYIWQRWVVSRLVVVAVRSEGVATN